MGQSFFLGTSAYVKCHPMAWRVFQKNISVHLIQLWADPTAWMAPESVSQSVNVEIFLSSMSEVNKIRKFRSIVMSGGDRVTRSPASWQSRRTFAYLQQQDHCSLVTRSAKLTCIALYVWRSNASMELD
jgi:hypothetical protein